MNRTPEIEQPRVITLHLRRRTIVIIIAVPVLLIATLTATFLWQMYQRARLNAAIEARGGYIFTHYSSGRLPTAWLPWATNRYTGAQTDVYFEDCNITDGWMASHDLSRFPGTLSIHLNETSITDESLRHVARYRRLGFLQLSGTQITDDGLVHLRECEKLSGLYLDDTAVTDAGLAHLVDMPQLSLLDVHGTNVTDAGIMHALDSLTVSSLTLNASVITDELATALASEQIYQLMLHGDAIPDALPLLTGITSLQHLSLDGDAVTDDCVPDLSRLTGLKYLNLTNTRLSRDGYDRFHEALPNCQMYVWLNWEGESE